MKILSSRIIVLLTPVFTAVSGVVAGWIAKAPLGHWLGLLPVNQGTILAAEITGATAALGAAITFLHHNSFWEKHVAGLFDVVDDSKPPPSGPINTAKKS